MNGQEAEDKRKGRNGESNKIVWWLLITITGIAITAASFWVVTITARVSRMETLQGEKGERISRLEEALKNLYMDLGKIDGRVVETNNKLDRLLEYWYSSTEYKRTK